MVLPGAKSPGSTLLGVRFGAADDPKAQNPGALTPTEYLTNPDSGAAGNIRRGADKDVTQQQLALLFKHVDASANEINVSVFGVLRNLNNPLATPPPIQPLARVPAKPSTPASWAQELC